jgi:hypothetical protein
VHAKQGRCVRWARCHVLEAAAQCSDTHTRWASTAQYSTAQHSTAVLGAVLLLWGPQLTRAEPARQIINSWCLAATTTQRARQGGAVGNVQGSKVQHGMFNPQKANKVAPTAHTD